MSTTGPDEPSRRATPWVAVGLTLVALLATATVLGRPAAADTAGAAAWFPPDGHRSRFAAAGDTLAREWSRPSAFSLLQTGSTEFWVWAQITDVEWGSATYQRVMSHLVDATGASQGSGEALWVLDDTGARLALERRPDGEAIVLAPGRLDLPAGLGAGDTWTSEGELAHRAAGQDWAVHTYRAQYTAIAAGDPDLAGRGCLVVNREFGYADTTTSDEQTWCPGAGVVAGSESGTRWTPGGAAPTPVPADATAFDWGRVDALDFTTNALNQTGAGIPHVSPVAPPGIGTDGSIVFANQTLPDVVALDPGNEPALLAWHGRPGATPTTAGTFAGITVVATAARTAVGYGAQGQWLWETTLSDITRVPPVRFGATVVFATLDGRVTALDLATGTEAWHADLPGELRTRPLVAGDRLLIGDQTGALTCLDATGGQSWVVDAGVARSLAVTAGPDPVVVVGRDASTVLQAFRVSDGARLWRTRFYDDARDAVALAGRFVLRDSDRTTAIDAATGQPVWTWDGARTWAAIGGDQRVLLLTDTELVLLDADGRPVKSWPHGLGDISQSATFLTAGEDSVVAYGPLSMSVGRLP